LSLPGRGNAAQGNPGVAASRQSAANCDRNSNGGFLPKTATPKADAPDLPAGENQLISRRAKKTAAAKIILGCCNFTDFADNKLMVDRDKIQFDLITLLNGERILRLTEPQSGLALEQKLAPADAVVRQKEKLLSAFQAALARVELSSA
jgi:hypothetical protein